MSRFIISRLALPVVLAASLLPAAALAQSQDDQSVADAARRARDQKKPPVKPAKVITNEDIKPAPQSGPATPASPDAAASPAAPASSASSAAAPAGATGADAKDQRESKEVTELKAQIKKALDDLNLVLREQTLENDKYYSNPDPAHNTAGKAKLDELIQEAIDKQRILEQLKVHLAELLPPQNTATSAPPKP
jgi:enamine deaminase RidA (YjgF/YER057c/UK114 family)